jgi:hypothetical protein
MPVIGKVGLDHSILGGRARTHIAAHWRIRVKWRRPNDFSTPALSTLDRNAAFSFGNGGGQALGALAEPWSLAHHVLPRRAPAGAPYPLRTASSLACVVWGRDAASEAAAMRKLAGLAQGSKAAQAPSSKLSTAA